MTLKGIGSSQGISIGNIHKMTKQDFVIPFYNVHHYEDEIKRFETAVNDATNDLIVLKSHISNTIDHAHAMIFEAHIQMVNDIEVIKKMKHRIEHEKVNAEYLYDDVMSSYISLIEAMEEEYFRARAVDLIDVKQRVLSQLLKASYEPFKMVGDDIILAAKDLTPSDIASLDQTKIIGIITELGGKTSHTTIIAKSLDIPVVVGIETLLKQVHQGERVIVDGNEGIVMTSPTEALIHQYITKKESFTQHKNYLETLKHQETITKDGLVFKLVANISFLEDLKVAQKNGASGIGLFRTEYLIIDQKNQPNEDSQYEAYKQVLSTFKHDDVIIRTFDIGGDKTYKPLSTFNESNPFLGLRGLRHSMSQKDAFKRQIKALLRASIHGNLHIMFPMVTTIEDIKEAKKLVSMCQDELKKDHIIYQKDIKIGMMIEVPSNAIMAAQFAKEVDFFSIGTNDLTQYVMASDRTNTAVSKYYQPLHPAVLKLIKMVIDAARHEGIPVSVCGEIASDERALPILIGLGVDTFSVHPNDILKSRALISKYTHNEMHSMAEHALSLSSEDEVINYMRQKPHASKH
jgi:phosphotransferase system enzyme I (PtsI)